MATSNRTTTLVVLRTLAIATWLAAVASPGVAATSGGNLGFLKDAPITRFTGADLQMFRSNVADALEQAADGDSRRWQNPKTGSSGEIALVKTFEQDGKRCRRTRIINRARGYAEAHTDAVFCKEADGRWKVLTQTKQPPAGPANKPATD